jgi:hypothetical protein
MGVRSGLSHAALGKSVPQNRRPRWLGEAGPGHSFWKYLSLPAAELGPGGRDRNNLPISPVNAPDEAGVLVPLDWGHFRGLPTARPSGILFGGGKRVSPQSSWFE